MRGHPYGSVSLAAIAILVAGALAGCSAPRETTSTTAPPLSDLPGPGEVPVAFHADGAVVPLDQFAGGIPQVTQRFVANRSSGEPTVGVNARGAALYPSIKFDALPPAAAATGRQLPRTLVYVTTDNGTTWADRTPSFANVGALASAPASLDPFVYADPVTGRFFTIDLYVGCADLSFSDDDGVTWTTNPIACGIPADDHQSIIAGPVVPPAVASPLYPNALYYCINQVAASTCSRSLDGGLSWEAAGSPAFPGADPGTEGGDPGFCGGLSGHLYASWKTGTVFLPKGQCGKAMVARSTDNGVTWQAVTVDASVGFNGHDGAMAADANGTLYYMFLDGKTLPRVSVSHDDGVTWGRPMNVTAPGVTTAKFPAITAGDAGRIAFLYVGSTTPHGPKYATGCTDPPLCDSGTKYKDELHNATWNAYITFSLDADGPQPLFAAVTANPLADPLARGYCSGRCYKSGGNGMFDFLDIQHNPKTGQVWASLVDMCVEACAGPQGTDRDIADSRGAVAVQVGGPTLRASAVPTA